MPPLDPIEPPCTGLGPGSAVAVAAPLGTPRSRRLALSPPRVPKLLACALGWPLVALGTLLVLTPLPGGALMAAGLGLLSEHLRFAREWLVGGRRRLRLARQRWVPARSRA